MKNIVNYLDDFIDDMNESCSISKVKRGNRKYDVDHEALKAYKKNSREEEIEKHGKPINHNHVVQSKKVYTRKDKHKNNIKF